MKQWKAMLLTMCIQLPLCLYLSRILIAHGDAVHHPVRWVVIASFLCAAIGGLIGVLGAGLWIRSTTRNT